MFFNFHAFLFGEILVEAVLLLVGELGLDRVGEALALERVGEAAVLGRASALESKRPPGLQAFWWR